jgi:hypothetical protein
LLIHRLVEFEYGECSPHQSSMLVDFTIIGTPKIKLAKTLLCMKIVLVLSCIDQVEQYWIEGK